MAALAPTFHGYVDSTIDALLVFEACCLGHLLPVTRGPHDKERGDLIKSGNVFVYRKDSTIKHWNDGVSWSSSRVLDELLFYRELEHHTFKIKEGGLLKKVVSANVNGGALTLISYYTVADVEANKFTTPSNHLTLKHIIPRHDLVLEQHFKFLHPSPNAPFPTGFGKVSMEQTLLRPAQTTMPPTTRLPYPPQYLDRRTSTALGSSTSISAHDEHSSVIFSQSLITPACSYQDLEDIIKIWEEEEAERANLFSRSEGH
jgi:hypothetical protein